MGSRRSVLDSQAIRDFEDMRLQQADDPGRWPRYDVELDEAGETARRALGALLPDVVSHERLDAASAPPGVGEDFTISDIGGMSWKTEAERQRDLASMGMVVSHAKQASLRGSYPEVVRAVLEALAHHGHRLLVLAETDTGLRIKAYMPRPWYGGAAGRMLLDLALPSAKQGAVEVAATAECEGTMGMWSRGRTTLERVLSTADAILRGETPKAMPSGRRSMAALRPEGGLQWAWLAVVAVGWALLALVAIMRFVEDGGSLLATLAALTVTGLLVTCVYLWIKFRYL